MKKIARTALLPYSAQQVYALVNDVKSYPEFLPWCGGSEVIAESEYEMEASVTIAKAGIKQTFKTRNQLVPGERIEMHLLDGPFKSLSGEWEFKALDGDACKIQFEVEFEVSSGI
ncbi:MAG TPA: type II toxin-antitoxin system RatA family toxin, partial [Thiomicrospira sp.]|nr:type II toxin-antitoxin system RatA family toxin [Thiomicrospira sp.]